MKLLKKLRKLEQKHLRELALLNGGMALLLLLAVFIGGGGIERIGNPVAAGGISPRSQTASIFPCSWTGNCSPTSASNVYGFTASPTSVPAGQAATLTWTSAREVGGSYIPACQGPYGTGKAYNMHCYIYPGGAEVYTGDISGSMTVYPAAGTNTYTFCSQFMQDQGYSCLNATVVAVAPPTPTTLNYFYASPSTIPYNANATLYYSGNPGTYGIGLYLGGYGYVSGWSGSIARGPLTSNTAYGIYTVDNYYGWVGPWYTSVAVAAPVAPKGPCNDIPLQATLPNGCVAPASAPGTCIPAGGSYSGTTNTCSCPVGKHLEGASCVTNPLCSNGLNDSYAPSCACPAHQYQPGGVSSCLPLPVCTNGLSEAYSPSCACPADQLQIPGGSTCVQKGVIKSLTAEPTRVRKGNTGTVAWNTASMVSCALKGPVNGAFQTLSTDLSGSKTVTVATQSVYTLSCTDQAGASYSSTATINLVPEVEEQ